MYDLSVRSPISLWTSRFSRKWSRESTKPGSEATGCASREKSVGLLRTTHLSGTRCDPVHDTLRTPTKGRRVSLTAAVTRLAAQYGRYGYRRIHALLLREGWQVSHSRVIRIWRQEGLKVPYKQPKRSRLWLNDSSCIRLSPKRRNHV